MFVAPLREKRNISSSPPCVDVDVSPRLSPSALLCCVVCHATADSELSSTLQSPPPRRQTHTVENKLSSSSSRLYLAAPRRIGLQVPPPLTFDWLGGLLAKLSTNVLHISTIVAQDWRRDTLTICIDFAANFSNFFLTVVYLFMYLLHKFMIVSQTEMVLEVSSGGQAGGSEEE